MPFILQKFEIGFQIYGKPLQKISQTPPLFFFILGFLLMVILGFPKFTKVFQEQLRISCRICYITNPRTTPVLKSHLVKEKSLIRPISRKMRSFIWVSNQYIKRNRFFVHFLFEQFQVFSFEHALRTCQWLLFSMSCLMLTLKIISNTHLWF